MRLFSFCQIKYENVFWHFECAASDSRLSCLRSNKGMDHLSTMKKKNVVLVYDLLLEMLDANTSSSSSQTSSSPSSDTYSDQHQCPPPPPHLQPDQDPTAVPLHGSVEAQILDRQLQPLPLQCTPPPQGSVGHMDNK